MFTWPQLLEDGQKVFVSGADGYKVLEVYMGEAFGLTKPLGTYLAIMLRIVVVLFGQHEDQLKCGLPWMEVHI